MHRIQPCALGESTILIMWLPRSGRPIPGSKRTETRLPFIALEAKWAEFQRRALLNSRHLQTHKRHCSSAALSSTQLPAARYPSPWRHRKPAKASGSFAANTARTAKGSLVTSYMHNANQNHGLTPEMTLVLPVWLPRPALICALLQLVPATVSTNTGGSSLLSDSLDLTSTLQTPCLLADKRSKSRPIVGPAKIPPRAEAPGG
jgi:hypothetical protein